MGKGIGIDLGGTNLRVWHAQDGLVMQEPALAAIDRTSGRIVKFGSAAEAMLKESLPANIMMSRSFKGGVVNQSETAQKVFGWCRVKTAGQEEKIRALIAVPCGLDSIEQSALVEVAYQAGFGEVFLVDAPLAALYGCGMTADSSALIVHIGATKTDILVVNHGECVRRSSCDVAGDAFDDAIISYVSRKYRVALNFRTAEAVKNRIGTVWTENGTQHVDVRGKDENGNRKGVTISSEEMFTIFEEPMALLMEKICNTILELPLDAVKPVFDTGIYLTGGCAQLDGLDKMITGVTGVRCRVANDPELAVARGLGVLLNRAPDKIRSGCTDFGEILFRKNG